MLAVVVGEEEEVLLRLPDEKDVESKRVVEAAELVAVAEEELEPVDEAEVAPPPVTYVVTRK